MTYTITSHSRIYKICMASILALVALFSFFWLASQAGETPNSPLATPPPDAFIGRNGSICLYNNFTTAMNAANSGDTLYIKQGTHLKTIGTITKTLTFAAASSNCTTLSGTDVTLDANDLSRMAIIDPSISVTFTNLVLTNGSDDNGGILFIYDNSMVVLKNTDLTSGAATFSGGAVYMMHATLDAQYDSRIYLNTAAGAMGGGGIYAHQSTINLRGTTEIGYLNGNTTAGDGGRHLPGWRVAEHVRRQRYHEQCCCQPGGGVYALNGAQVYLHDNTKIGWAHEHYGNHALEGGGIFLYGSGTGLLMYDNSAIENNLADSYGGGIYLGVNSFRQPEQRHRIQQYRFHRGRRHLY